MPSISTIGSASQHAVARLSTNPPPKLDIQGMAEQVQAHPDSHDAVLNGLLKTDPGAIFHLETALRGNASFEKPGQEAVSAKNNRDRLNGGGEPLFQAPNPTATVQVRSGVQVGGQYTSNQGRVQITAPLLSAQQRTEINQELSTAHQRQYVRKIDDARVTAGIPAGVAGLGLLAGGAATIAAASRTLGLTLVAATAYLVNQQRVIDRDYSEAVNGILSKYGLPELTQNQLLHSPAPNR